MGSTGGGVWKTTDAGHTWVNVSDRLLLRRPPWAPVEVSLSDPNIDLRRHRRRPRSAAMSPSAAASTNPPMPARPGPSPACATPARSPPSASIPPIPRSSTSPPSAIPSPAIRSAASIAPPMAAGTWQQGALSFPIVVGAADLELQPGSPNVLFACMWHGQRKPWTIISGAQEGGIYKSTDGGDTWTKLAGGLPDELFGRGNVAISAAKPNRIYALIEAKPGSGLYRSRRRGRDLEPRQRRRHTHHPALLLRHPRRRSQ